MFGMFNRSRDLRTEGVWIAVVLVVIFATLRYDNFMGLYNVQTFFGYNSMFILIALGMALVIMTGGIDLSVGSVVALSSVVADEDGQILEAHSVSAGLDYPGIGPEHAFLHEIGRAEYVSATDDAALEAFPLCAKLEGILPALESSHALPETVKVAQELGNDGLVVVNISGRGDKDIFTIADKLGEDIAAGTAV